MKKLLSIVLALSLCLTAMMGCFVVSAETTVPSIKIADVKAAPGAVAIAVTGENFKDVCAADLVITLEEGLTFVSLAKDGELLEGNLEAEDGVHYVINGQSIRYLDIFNGFEGYNTTTLNLVINATAAADGEYDVTATIDAATIDEEFIKDIVIDAGVVTIHTHTYTVAKYDEEGHWTACACEDATAVTEKVPHTLGDYVANEDGTTETATCTGCEYSVTRDIEIVEPECDHANKTFVSAVPAVDGTDGSITFTCDDCGESVVETVEYYMYYSFSADSASYASEIVYNFTARKDLLEYQGKYSELFVYFEKESAESDDLRKEIVDVADATERKLNGRDAYQFSIGIPAKELTDNVRGVAFVNYNNQWYNGMIKESTVATYCASMMGKSDTPEAEKKLIVDALHYGAAAQINFRNYHIDFLATDVLTEQQIQTYATTGTANAERDASNPFDANDHEDNVIVSKYSLSAESKVTINYTFNTVYYQDPIEDLRAVFTYEGLDGESVYVYKDLAVDDKYFTHASGTTYTIEFTELAAPDMRKDVTLTIYSGDRQVSCGTVYSIEAHIKAMRSKSTTPATELALYNEMLQYGDSAAAYFG